MIFKNIVLSGDARHNSTCCFEITFKNRQKYCYLKSLGHSPEERQQDTHTFFFLLSFSSHRWFWPMLHFRFLFCVELAAFFLIEKMTLAGHRWLTLVILATQEAEIRRIVVHS
jgi:hypothetical protein